MPSAPRTFAVKGVVRELRPTESEVIVQHERISGYMDAMTMPFRVKNTNELAGLEPGSPVSFRLTVTDTDGWIEDIRKLDGRAALAASPVRIAKDVEPLNPGDPLPPFTLTNQFGHLVTTDSFKGNALAITFLFTRCPFPTYCPLMNKNFAEAQASLKSTSSRTNWQLLTVSFDPEFDTPAVLKAYAEFHAYDPNHWTFASGSLVDVTALTEAFGLVFWREQGGSLSHNLRTAVLDTHGRVKKIFQGNQWTSDELIKELLQAAEP